MQLLRLSEDSPVFRCGHMLELPEPVLSSTGLTSVYWDGIGACLCVKCVPYIRDYFEASLLTEAGSSLWPVASGASGATILGLLGRGTYLSSKAKLNGPSWRNLEQARQTPGVVLVDDCIFTGTTFDYLRASSADAGLVIVREAVLFDGRSGRSPGQTLGRTRTR